MQVLGKRSKVLLVVIAIVMLVAVGVSFAVWDTSAVKATNGDLSSYANAKVGDIIEFGKYYQTLEQDGNGEYIKTPIEWIVVDKDERTGQLTLMSKYILACGSYFGNYYDDGTGGGYKYSEDLSELGGNAFNQAYVDSTARAFLNNLERHDMGGDKFDNIVGYVPSGIDSAVSTGLLSSVGFSNKKYYTGLNYNTETIKAIVDAGDKGLIRRSDVQDDVMYRRPINSQVFKNRPVARGFYDEAFNNEEKSVLVPKSIAGNFCHRWPNSSHNIATKQYVEGVVDKVWLPSVTELNIMEGLDWNNEKDEWTSPSDEAGATVFEYYKNFAQYLNPYDRNRVNTSLFDAMVGKRTEIAKNGACGNYSIPVYLKGSTDENTAISTNSSANTSDRYWTRSPMSPWFFDIRVVEAGTGKFVSFATRYASVGVRPCVILKY